MILIRFALVTALSISTNVVPLEAVLAVPCRLRFLWFGYSFTHSDYRRARVTLTNNFAS